MPSELRAAAPGPARKHQRDHPEEEAIDVVKGRPGPGRRRLDDGLERRRAARGAHAHGWDRPGRRYRTGQLHLALIVRLAGEFQGYARDLHDQAVPDDPADSGFPDEATTTAWHERGEWLAKRLAAVLRVRTEFRTARGYSVFGG